MKELHPCWRCGCLNFWRARDGVIHCAQCSPPRAHYLIAARLRASAVPRSQLDRAVGFIGSALKEAGSIEARSVIDAARRAKIALATLMRARWKLGLLSVKTRRGWVWIRRA